MIRLKTNYGSRFKAGAEIPVEEIGQAEFERLRDQGLAEVIIVVSGDGATAQDLAQAIQAYLGRVASTVELLVTVLDLAEAGGDEEAIAFADAMRSIETGPMAAMGSRIQALLHRAYEASVDQLDHLQAADTLALRFEAMSDGGQGAEGHTSAPEISELPAVLFDVHYASPRGEWFVDKGLTLEAAEARKAQLLQMGDEPSPAARIEPHAPAEQSTSAPNTAGAEAGSTDKPRSEGGGDGPATEAPAPVVEAEAAATSEVAQDAPAPKGGRKKSGAA